MCRTPAAEAEVLDRAARLTPGSLRAAIARAVLEAAPEKARKRRETGAKFARLERWLEDSGNAALAGRELPPDQALAADERITARANELRNAGVLIIAIGARYLSAGLADRYRARNTGARLKQVGPRSCRGHRGTGWY